MTLKISRERLNLVFWLEVFKEHTIFIKQALPCNERKLIEKAKELQNKFEELHTRANRINYNPFTRNDDELLRKSIITTKKLLDFKENLLQRSIRCQLDIKLYPLLLDHLIREAEEFLALTNTYYNNNMDFAQNILREEVFWLEIMEDHLRFICHLLDPSETTFITQSQDLAQKFAALSRQAQNLKSMSQINPDEFPKVSQFTNQVISETKKLYQFKKTAQKLLEECKILAIAPPLLAEHVAEEAGHFLTVIQQINHYFQKK